MTERVPSIHHRESAKRRESYSGLNVNLTTNSTLNQMCEAIQTTKPDWEYITNAANRNSNAGELVELHVKHVLEKIAASEINVNVNPIFKNVQTENFRFGRTNNNNIVAIDKNTTYDVTEYDSLTIVDSLPVVFESKIKGGDFLKGSRLLTDKPFETEKINDIFTPLQEFYDTKDFGYVVVTVPERFAPNDPIQQQFQQQGGLLLSLSTPLEEFKCKKESATVFDAKQHISQRKHHRKVRTKMIQ